MQAIKSIPQSIVRNPHSTMLSICLAGMDACWIFTASWLFSKVVLAGVVNIVLPPVVLLALLELGGWGMMAYLLDHTSLPLGAVRAIMGGVGLLLAVGISVALNPFDAATYSVIWIIVLVFGVLLSLGLWLLGGYRATERVAFEDVYSAFRLGLVVIAASALFSTFVANSRINDLWAELGGVSTWFFVFSLAGLALGNREAVRRETGNLGMKSWGWMVAASVGVILLMSLLGQALGGQDVVSSIQSVIVGVLLVVGTILFGLLYIVLWPFSLVGLNIEGFNYNPQQSQPPATPQNEGLIEKAQKEWTGASPISIPAGLETLFMVVAAALIIGVALYLMTRWLRRTRADRPDIEEEEREGFGSWSLFVAQVRTWINRLLARFRKPVPATVEAEEDDLAALVGNAEMRGTLSVRQIYARLLKLAGTAGYPRAAYQTPVEYLGFLSAALPNLRGELNDITAAYQEARYGPVPVSPMAVQAAASAWRRAEMVLVEENAKRNA
ncbi:MAG: DUF4129 domain-containing protein [Chloroflexota bacterium]